MTDPYMQIVWTQGTKLNVFERVKTWLQPKLKQQEQIEMNSVCEIQYLFEIYGLGNTLNGTVAAVLGGPRYQVDIDERPLDRYTLTTSN